MGLCEGIREPGSGSKRNLLFRASAGICPLLLTVLAACSAATAEAQTQRIVPCPAQQQNLITVPEIKSANGKLRATLKLVDGVRTMWGYSDDARCATQNLRFLQGVDPANPKPWPSGPDPIPGPTFRARVGDLVEIAFYNQINTNNFASTLDRGAFGSTPACDQYTTSTSADSARTKVPGGDSIPNCLHGSSTTNVHFHGTHTTPSTTGDNVLLFVRPALRTSTGQIQPSEAQASVIFDSIFRQCERQGPPQRWADLPTSWQNLQKSLIQRYDSTAPYLGKAGALPDSSKIWPINNMEINKGLWPQYHLGANPYCFPLPTYDPSKMKMGQAPGTHWYHAHKHGSTALNVANGMVGTFIIEGQYDDDLKRFYGPNFVQQVLMIEQLSAAPFPLTTPTTKGPGAARPRLFINGRLNPLISMRPNEVQLWRITDGAFRDAVKFVYFEPQKTTPCASNKPPAAPAPAAPQWRQIAQDGVQFNVANYSNPNTPFNGSVNSPFNIAPANRADILVKSPTQPGNYTLCVIRNVGVWTLAIQGKNNLPMSNGAPDSIPPITPLLTVSVAGAPVTPAMDFIPNAQFPTFPSFLSDIPDSAIVTRRTLTFGPGNSTINNKMFEDHTINQSMTLNTAEEWVVQSQADDKSHPFHIHINPFQVIEVFEPNNPMNMTGNCKPDPLNPATYDPAKFDYVNRESCIGVPGPWVWWDTFAIPTARQVNINSTCTVSTACPANIQSYVTCGTTTLPGNTAKTPFCYVTMNGWFKMRSRFVDYTGQYVLHCHILIHEDRGMMQLIEVVPDKTPYSHH
jgi:FtsP/CotA-like multicopper oxidase with cupredoxin domain